MDENVSKYLNPIIIGLICTALVSLISLQPHIFPLEKEASKIWYKRYSFQANSLVTICSVTFFLFEQITSQNTSNIIQVNSHSAPYYFLFHFYFFAVHIICHAIKKYSYLPELIFSSNFNPLLPVERFLNLDGSNANTAKLQFERFCLRYSFVWISCFGVIIVGKLYESFNEWSYMIVCVGLSLPFLLQVKV
jgi:hypothetical protein